MLTIQAEKRDSKIKSSVIREKGKIPAVFYGRKEKSTPISVSEPDFLKAWGEAGESTIVGLAYEGKDLSALIQDVEVDAVRGNPIHIDFYVTEADREVEVDVPLQFVGESVAVKELGGTLVKVLHDLPVVGLPKDLPHEIQVDISSLTTVESQVLVSDLALPAGVKPQGSMDDVVAAIAIAKEEEEAPAAEFDASAIEIEKKGKEESAEGEGEEPTKAA